MAGISLAILLALVVAHRSQLYGYGATVALCSTLFAWIFLSVFDVTLNRDVLESNPARFANLANGWPDVRVGIALSGGGYRAALMHAGVLHALEEMHVHPTHLSTVSGGSIIGAFYAHG